MHKNDTYNKIITSCSIACLFGVYLFITVNVSAPILTLIEKNPLRVYRVVHSQAVTYPSTKTGVQEDPKATAYVTIAKDYGLKTAHTRAPQVTWRYTGPLQTTPWLMH